MSYVLHPNTTVYALFPMDMTRPADGNDSSGLPVIRGGKSGLLFLRSPGSAGQVFLQANLDQEAHDAIQVRKASRCGCWGCGCLTGVWVLPLRCCAGGDNVGEQPGDQRVGVEVAE